MKIRKVTRTLTTTTANVACFDKANATFTNEEYVITGKYTPEQLDKFFAKDGKDEFGELQPIRVLSVDYTEKLYALSELDFVKYGEVVEKPDSDDSDATE